VQRSAVSQPDQQLVDLRRREVVDHEVAPLHLRRQPLRRELDAELRLADGALREEVDVLLRQLDRAREIRLVATALLVEHEDLVGGKDVIRLEQFVQSKPLREVVSRQEKKRGLDCRNEAAMPVALQPPEFRVAAP